MTFFSENGFAFRCLRPRPGIEWLRYAGGFSGMWLAMVVLAGLIMESNLPAADAVFFRGFNLNGTALEIDGRLWEGNGTSNLSFKGGTFENQAVLLKPPTDPARASMIRSSIWGGNADLTLNHIPEGSYQVFLYVWEDNHSEKIDLLVNDRPVLEGFHSGNAGMWKKLGPWKCESHNGKIKVSARSGAANLSGVEIWSGTGPVPQASSPEFSSNPSPDQVAFFESKIRPLFIENCYSCHSAKAEKIKGGLLLDSRKGLVKGGDTGPSITPGDPEASLLIEAVRHKSEDMAMPPKKKLPPEQIAALEEWVRMGAPDPRTDDTVAVVTAKNAIDWNQARQWWSIKPLALPERPAVKQAKWPVNELDYFILDRLEKAGIRPAPDAEKRKLLRRATYDLTGLPPTPSEVEAFLSDKSRKAFARVVDRLLASPRYGERWGRYWLDVARYADTAGDNSDFPIPQMHRYRDWVISAFNRDMPYDEFLKAQLAGDLLPASNEQDRHEKIIATGYIAAARRFGSRVDDYPQHLTIEDTIDNFGRAFLGLTINCARCHDHKFDPITTQDYYALYGIFNSTRYPWAGIELEKKQRDLVPLGKPGEIAVFEQEKSDAQKGLDAEVKRIEKELKAVEAVEGEAKKDLEKNLTNAKEAAHKNAVRQPPYDMAYAVSEGSKRQDAQVQHKGDPSKPGPEVRRRFLTVLGGTELPAEDHSSGRLRLVDWILDRNNPLPARVMVNRIWLHHFGRGLVATPNDFGKQGKPPTHPELLDWLASRFIREGWSVKKMHRLIMLSHTYRLSGEKSSEMSLHDPNNELLGAFPRRRLDAEAIRDSLLFLGGSLDETPGGAHPFPAQEEWKFTQHNPFKAVYESNKRSIYLMTQRIQRHPYLAIFDGADPSVSTAFRSASTTPLQALYLLNDSLVHEQARGLAVRLLKEKKEDSRLQLAYSLVFSRPADRDEIVQGRSFLNALRAGFQESGVTDDKIEMDVWQAFARVLFRLNEFVYLD